LREEAVARFDNKVVLISGGARGQGAAEARMLVAEGAKVVITRASISSAVSSA
jgi:NAD(P)-dependent dehydrogenase (short-subunit alcohol dehydrogenase family)